MLIKSVGFVSVSELAKVCGWAGEPDEEGLAAFVFVCSNFPWRGIALILRL